MKCFLDKKLMINKDKYNMEGVTIACKVFILSGATGI